MDNRSALSEGTKGEPTRDVVYQFRRASLASEDNRRYSIAPLLEPGDIPEILAHKKPKAERGVITHEEGQILDKANNPPLLPLDPIKGVTIGLELLINANRLYVREHTENEEALFGVESINRYDIMDELYQRMYYGWESESEGCGSSRGFTIRLVDYSGRPVLVIRRHYSWCECLMQTINCCGTYGTNVSVSIPDGNRLGKIKQKYKGCTPTFGIQDEYGNDLFIVRGPSGVDCCWGCNICLGEVTFRVYPTKDATEEIAIITKTWATHFVGDSKTSSNLFGVQFLRELMPVNYKAVLLGTIFTIDAMFFNRDVSKSLDLPSGEEVKSFSHIMPHHHKKKQNTKY